MESTDSKTDGRSPFDIMEATESPAGLQLERQTASDSAAPKVPKKEMSPHCNVGSKRLKQSTLHYHTKKGNESTTVNSFLAFEQLECRKSLAMWVIIDEMLFRTVETDGFRDMMHVVQPRFTLPSRRTLVQDCIGIYEYEKSKLEGFLKNYKRRVCLTTDIWTPCQNLSYMALTAHFIDDKWNLHKKILNLCPIFGHTEFAIGKKVEECLISWKIENLFTITADNASANDVGISYLKEKFKKFRGGLVLDGEFLHMRCGGHILNLIVKDGLNELKGSIERIRFAILYIRSSSSRTQTFKKLMEKKNLNTNAVASLDVNTRWNSTYTMLESALRVKDAFDELELEDDKYREELRKNGKEPPSGEDWEYARGFLPFLKCFYDTTARISGSRYVTGNLYMKEIFKVAYNIHSMSSSSDSCIRLMAFRMKAKFFKYWGDWRNVNPMIYLATVLDPRNKMSWVKFIVSRVYEENEAKELIEYIQSMLRRMFDEYNANRMASIVEPSSSQPHSCVTSDFSTIVDDFEEQLQREIEEFEATKEQGVMKSELDKYLNEECEKRQQENFDILYWWKTTGSKYPTLSLMASDLLAIPVSTVASESAFSTGGRVIDPFRSSLSPKLVQALICAQDWLRKDNPFFEDHKIVEKIEKLEDGINSHSCV